MKTIFTYLLIIIFSFGFSYTDKKPKLEKDSITSKKEVKAPEKKVTEVKKNVEEPVFHPLILFSIQR